MGTCLYDGDLELAVRVDFVHYAVDAALERDAGRGAGDVLSLDRSADLSLAVSRISCGGFWSACAAIDWGVSDRFLSWVLAAAARSTFELYLTYGLFGGIGTGIIYVGVVGLMARWFPDRRGLACGIVAAGYGMGAIVTTFPIASALSQVGYQKTLISFGLIFGVVGILAAQGMRRRPPEPEPRTSAPDLNEPRAWPRRSSADAGVVGISSLPTGVGPGLMLMSPVFWVMFLMMTMMSTSGLMVISQMAAFAKDFGVANAMVLGTAALPLALTIDRFTNGLTRPFFGWLSDRIGREQTMGLAFGLEGIAMFVWLSTPGKSAALCAVIRGRVLRLG